MPAVLETRMAMDQAAQNELVQRKIQMDGLRKQLDPGKDEKAKLRESCEGFESIFIQKMWEQMRKNISKEGYLHSKDEESYQSMFDVELSKKMASAGGIGLADMMYLQLSQKLEHAGRTTTPGAYRAPVNVPAAAAAQPEGAATQAAAPVGKLTAENLYSEPEESPAADGEAFEAAAPIMPTVAGEAGEASTQASGQAPAQALGQAPDGTLETAAVETLGLVRHALNELQTLVEREDAANPAQSAPVQGIPLQTAMAPASGQPGAAQMPGRPDAAQVPGHPGIAPVSAHPGAAQTAGAQGELLEASTVAGIDRFGPVAPQAGVEENAPSAAGATNAAGAAGVNAGMTGIAAPNQQASAGTAAQPAAAQSGRAEAGEKPGAQHAALSTRADRKNQNPRTASWIGHGPVSAEPKPLPRFKRTQDAPPATQPAAGDLPVKGAVVEGFGWSKDAAGEKRWNGGLNIATTAGAPVQACMDGSVVYVGEQPGMGSLVVLEHEGGLRSYYAGVDAGNLAQGAKVKRGSNFASVAAQPENVTGAANTALLHFEIKRGEMAVNPETILGKSTG